jgi:RND family efflux transporter MFP subunit
MTTSDSRPGADARPPSRRAALAAHAWLLCAGLWAATLAACGPTPGGEAESAGPRAREATRVRTSAVERREMVRTVETTTTVESEREVKLQPRVAGVVVALFVEEGDQVKKGDVLLELDPAAAQNALADARVRLAEADDSIKKADLAVVEAEARQNKLRLEHEQKVREHDRNEKAGLVSAQQLDSLRVARDGAASEVDSARLGIERAKAEASSARIAREKAALALERAQLDLAWTRLEAPFDGLVAARTARVGDSIGAATPAFTLTDASDLVCVLHRPQRELALYSGAKEALEIHARAEALPKALFRGALKRISPAIDPTSGSFRLVVALDPAAESEEAGRLLPGMLVRVEIVVERHPDALVVPKRSLRREGDESMVYLVEGGRAARVRVREGFTDDEHVEILPEGRPIEPGARVVVVGNRELEDGAEVAEESAADQSARPSPAGRG